mgnify:CR=1 FL=1
MVVDVEDSETSTVVVVDEAEVLVSRTETEIAITEIPASSVMATVMILVRTISREDAEEVCAMTSKRDDALVDLLADSLTVSRMLLEDSEDTTVPRNLVFATRTRTEIASTEILASSITLMLKS